MDLIIRGNWKRKSDREQMLLKAAQVVFEEMPSSSPRYPTDHWAGYGLSYSLPADLLKVAAVTFRKQQCFKGLLSSPNEEPPGRMIEGRSARSVTVVHFYIQEDNIARTQWTVFCERGRRTLGLLGLSQQSIQSLQKRLLRAAETDTSVQFVAARSIFQRSLPPLQSSTLPR